MKRANASIRGQIGTILLAACATDKQQHKFDSAKRSTRYHHVMSGASAEDRDSLFAADVAGKKSSEPHIHNFEYVLILRSACMRRRFSRHQIIVRQKEIAMTTANGSRHRIMHVLKAAARMSMGLSFDCQTWCQSTHPSQHQSKCLSVKWFSIPHNRSSIVYC